jgi:hypothetical protein
MPPYFTKTLVITCAVGAALTCHIAFAATAAEGTVAPEDNTQSAAPAKPSRPYYLFIPDATIRAFQKSTERVPAWFSRYQSKQTSNVVNNKETENSASFPTPALFLSQEARPTTSLMIGWLPAKAGMNTPGPYQPDPYQYTSTETEAGGCQTVNRTASNAVETPYGGSKGLHLPAGWLLGMCLHY